MYFLKTITLSMQNRETSKYLIKHLEECKTMDVCDITRLMKDRINWK